MNKQTTQNEFAGKKLLSMLVVSGVFISGISFFMLGSGSTGAISATEVEEMCSGGLCQISTTESIPVGSFVQQSADLSNDLVASNSENFGSLKFLKTKIKDYELLGDSAMLYAAKDSFVREGISQSNEGANDVLRVMGSGPTNNRALVGFDQSDIETVTQGKSIESATLMLYIVSNDGKWDQGQKLDIYKITTAWSEGNDASAPFSKLSSSKGATWSCSDAANCVSEWNGGSVTASPTDSALITNEANGQWIEFDVTEDVQSFASGESNNGWVIMKSNEDAPGRINFAAKEAQTNIPQLEISFT